MAMTAAEAAAGRPAADAPPPLWRQAWEDLQPFPRRAGAAAVAATVESRVGAVEEGLRLLPFEPLGLRAAPGTAAALRGAAAEVEALNREIWLSPEALPDTADRLDRLADRFRAAAAAISGGRPAPGLQAPADLAADPFAPRLARLEGAAG